jgi:hypothetical protein
MSELLSEHEKSVNHMRAFQLWTELHQRLRLGKTIDVENQNSNLTLKPLGESQQCYNAVSISNWRNI